MLAFMGSPAGAIVSRGHLFLHHPVEQSYIHYKHLLTNCVYKYVRVYGKMFVEKFSVHGGMPRHGFGAVRVCNLRD